MNTYNALYYHPRSLRALNTYDEAVTLDFIEKTCMFTGCYARASNDRESIWINPAGQIIDPPEWAHPRIARARNF